MTEKPLALPHVIGLNVEKIRGANTRDNVADHGRTYGAPWSGGSIRAIERGEFKATVETLALLALALTDLRGDDGPGVTIADLLETDQKIQLTESAQTTPANLQDWLAGGGVDALVDPSDMVRGMMRPFLSEMEELADLNHPKEFDSMRGVKKVQSFGPATSTERRLAKRIGIHPHEFRAWSLHLWGEMFEDHRDEIAGPGATAQKKGNVSKPLLDEIQAAMRANRGDD